MLSCRSPLDNEGVFIQFDQVQKGKRKNKKTDFLAHGRKAENFLNAGYAEIVESMSQIVHDHLAPVLCLVYTDLNLLVIFIILDDE